MAAPQPIQGQRSGQRRPKNAGRIPEPFLLVIPGLLALGILIMLFIGNTGNGSKDTGDLEARVKRLEQGLARMETLDRRISQLEEKVKEQNLRATETLSKQERPLARPQEQGAGVEPPAKLRPAEKPFQPEPQKGTEPPEKETRTVIHQVGAGETLFKVGRLYGVTVDDLRRWNNLPPGEGIRTGQKLRVEKPSSLPAPP